MPSFQNQKIRLTLYSQDRQLRRSLRKFVKAFENDFTLVEDNESLEPKQLLKFCGLIDVLFLPPLLPPLLKASDYRHFSTLTLQEKSPVKIVILGDGDKVEHLQFASQVNASGCLSISNNFIRFNESLRHLLGVENVFLIEPSLIPPELQLRTLSTRETQVLHLAAKGLSPSEIATLLDISKFAVKHQLRTAFEKSGVEHFSKQIGFEALQATPLSGSK